MRDARRVGRTRYLFSSLSGYQRPWLANDLLAGLTLLAIAIPEQLATSRLAGMPPVTGFYAFVAGSVMFALLGSNPHMSVGADSTIAPLFAVGVASMAPTGSPSYIHLVGLVAVLAGVMVALIGILRLGWIADYLSTPIIAGFLAGVGVIIIVHQLPDLLGLPAVSGSSEHRLLEIGRQLGSANLWDLGIGLGTLAIVFLLSKIDRRFPAALVALICSSAVVAAFSLQAHGVAVLGSFAHEAPKLGLQGLSIGDVGSTLPLAAVVALVVISQTSATTRAFDEDGERDGDVGHDFVGVGSGNVLAGLVGSFPVDASPPRTEAVVSAHGKTQLCALAAALAMVLLLPVSGILRYVPLATLAGILIFIALRLMRVRELVAIARFNWFELSLSVITVAAVVFIGVEQGIAVAVGLAVFDRARRSARPHLHVMGRIPGTTSWTPLATGGNLEEVPGVLVVLFAAPLWYGNAISFRREVESALSDRREAPTGFVLDAVGMSDVDYTGSGALDRVLSELHARHVEVAFARVGDRLRQALERNGTIGRVGTDRFFASVDEAAEYFGAATA